MRSLLYGPVRSRRYGLSLGINILPVDLKVCSFNCVYCQLGWNSKKNKQQGFPLSKTIIATLREQLPTFIEQKIDTIALSGNGEPTLHPDFDKIVAAILAIRKRHKHQPRIICLTNGTRLSDNKVRRALSKIDECCLKIDANSACVNLPVCKAQSKNQAQNAGKFKNLVVQSCFFHGQIENTNARAVNAWIKTVAQLKPLRVDLYTISRRTPTKGLRAVSTGRLNGIASKLQQCLSVPVRVCS